MSIVFICGSHPRHAFIARQLATTGILKSVIVEQREHFTPQPPLGIDEDLKELFIHHFAQRDRVEHDFFGEVNWPNVPIHYKQLSKLNSGQVHNLLTQSSPDILITYGCHMLTEETLNCVSGERWNCHGGLSPQYRGAITHFWPSYMLEPQMTGMTVHDLTQKLDAGNIVHQCVSDMVRGDTLHQVAARAVLKLGQELPQVIVKLVQNGSLDKQEQRNNGTLWLASKWQPEHLRLIYQTYQDQIVDLYLDKKISQKQPTLYRQIL
ncbi:MAG: formyltransferase family protein [Shewanella sp.]|uniref:formyltransferase family protein n=1 Tax=Shewanella sp. TaxID=50422 RepID=UPI0030033CA8